ncbi:MAG: glycosyltransferase family 2 protein [bacterium]
MSESFRISGTTSLPFNSLNIAVIIPAYNESKFIEEVVTGVIEFTGFPVCVVDDASQDDTSQRAEQAGAVVIRHKKNQGKGGAHQTGFKWALENNFQGIVVMDADGQHLPGEIKNFIIPDLINRSDIIIGCRKLKLNYMPWQRIFTNKLTSLVCSILAGQRINDSQSGFRYISTEVIKNVKLKTTKFQTETELIIRAARYGYLISQVEVSTVYGREKSHINPVVDTLRFLSLIGLLIREY